MAAARSAICSDEGRDEHHDPHHEQDHAQRAQDVLDLPLRNRHVHEVRTLGPARHPDTAVGEILHVDDGTPLPLGRGEIVGQPSLEPVEGLPVPAPDDHPVAAREGFVAFVGLVGEALGEGPGLPASVPEGEALPDPVHLHDEVLLELLVHDLLQVGVDGGREEEVRGQEQGGQPVAENGPDGAEPTRSHLRVPS